jgi:hypothetical protein
MVKARSIRWVFSVATFIGSALLFLVQPMAAKILLPVFGGSPAVWTAAMLFFQVALLGGYAYAHFSNQKWGAKWQSKAHLAILILISILLIATMNFDFIQSLSARFALSPFPAFAVGLILLCSVGLGYFMVASGSPTLQRWFSTTDDKDAKDPYFLYATSNVGSLLGLFAYPFLIEPNFGLSAQLTMWRVGFGILVLTFGVCASIVSKGSLHVGESNVTQKKSSIDWTRRFKWIFWSAIPSSTLLGVTSYVSTNVAPIPLIWIVPLTLYLLTFIIAFAKKQILQSFQVGRILPLLLVPLAFTICLEASEPILIISGFNLVVFFLVALLGHTRLSEDRPDVEDLTEFYLWISIGGAVGGAFNSLIAPAIFPTYFEYPLALGLACLIRPSTKQLEWNREWSVIVAVVAFAAVGAFKYSGMAPGQLRSALAIGIPLVVTFAIVERSAVFAIGIISIFAASQLFQIASPGQVLVTKRSFFGVHRVLNNVNYRSLVHGTTTHGRQSLDPAKVDLPLTYYHPTGPIGSVMRGSPISPAIKKVGLVGLGVGSLAAYGRSDQEFTFFEIDPEVLWIARDSGLYTFLKRGKAKTNYVLGDARITLSREPNESFDLLVLDAFSSDAIPTHLLTEQAINMYKSKLKKGGFILFHVSNRYLELSPVLAMTANNCGFVSFENIDAPQNDQERRDGKEQSKWVLLARDPGIRELFHRPMDWVSVDIPPRLKPWTDDYTNLLSALSDEAFSINGSIR